MTALHIAAANHSTEAASVLLHDTRTDVNLADRVRACTDILSLLTMITQESRTALSFAVQSGNIDLVQLLLAQVQLQPDIPVTVSVVCYAP